LCGMKQAGDAELVEAAKGGDKQAFTALVEKYSGHAYRLAYSILGNQHDAEDAVQEAFINLYRKISSFRGSSSFATWFYKIIRNLAYDKVRRKAAYRRAYEAYSGEGMVVNSPTRPDRATVQSELRAVLEEALLKLSPEHREILVLRELEGLSYNEIASVLGIKLGTVMSRLHYARLKLKQILEEGGWSELV